MSNFLGIEIGGTKLQLVIGNQNAEILQRFRFMIDPAAGADAIRHNIAETVSKIGSGLKGIGVGFGGPVNRVTGKVWTSYHVNGWTDFSLSDWLQGLTGAPVAIDNDANVAALAEAAQGAGAEFQNLFYVTLGSGVGGGFIMNKKIYHGQTPGELEVGHIRLDKKGTTLQSVCSGWAVDEKIRNAVKLNRSGKLAELVEGHIGPEAVVLSRAIQKGDQDAKRIFDETLDDLAFGLSHVVHILHPESIILGGGFSLIGEPIRRALNEKLPGYLMDAFQPGPVIQLSKFQEDAVPIGALVLAIQTQQSS